MERGTGLEPATICLEGRDSTTELPPLIPANPRRNDHPQQSSKIPCPFDSLGTSLSSALPAGSRSARCKLSRTVSAIELISHNRIVFLHTPFNIGRHAYIKPAVCSASQRVREPHESLPSDLNPARRWRAATICLEARDLSADRQALPLSYPRSFTATSAEKQHWISGAWDRD
jgi:hypothetical protein